MNYLNRMLRQLPLRCAWILVAAFALTFQICAVAADDKPAADPAVNISVTITGAVASPGVRMMPAGSHLSDALKLASPSLDADLSAVKVEHVSAMRPAETLNYLIYLANNTSDRNIVLTYGDTITVPHKLSASIEVSVRGQVANPGRFTLPAQSTFLDALSAAKGLTDDADRKRIAIQHANDVAQIPVDFDAAVAHRLDTGVNPVLNDGDIVIARSVARPNVFTISGGVLHPGEYPLRDSPVTLADAIGKAGGLADRARLKDVSILRSDGTGKATTVKVKADDQAVQATTVIQPGDNVTIPQGAPPQKVDVLQVIGIVISLAAVFGHH